MCDRKPLSLQSLQHRSYKNSRNRTLTQLLFGSHLPFGWLYLCIPEFLIYVKLISFSPVKPVKVSKSIQVFLAHTFFIWYQMFGIVAVFPLNGFSHLQILCVFHFEVYQTVLACGFLKGVSCLLYDKDLDSLFKKSVMKHSAAWVHSVCAMAPFIKSMCVRRWLMSHMAVKVELINSLVTQDSKTLTKVFKEWQWHLMMKCMMSFSPKMQTVTASFSLRMDTW